MIGGMCSCCCHEHAPARSAGVNPRKQHAERMAQSKAKVEAASAKAYVELSDDYAGSEEPKRQLQKARRRGLSGPEKAELWKTSPRAVETHLEGVVSFCGACSCDWGSDARGCGCECHAGVGVHRDWAVVGRWIHPQWRTIMRVLLAPFRWAVCNPLALAAFYTALLFTMAMLDAIPARVYVVGQVVVILGYSVLRAFNREAGVWSTTELKE